MDLQWPCARNGIASDNQYRKGLELGKILPPSDFPVDAKGESGWVTSSSERPDVVIASVTRK
jgi:hypothetical protein